MDVKILEDLSNAFGPSGFERDVICTAASYLNGMKLHSDAMYNLYAELPGNTGKKPVVMLDAHTDECSLMIQAIQENGRLSVLTLGSMHMSTLPAHSYLIRTRSGKLVRGITTSVPVHFATQAQAMDSQTIEEIFLDVGASDRREVMEDYGIHIGDPAVPEVTFDYDCEHDICFGKAFDNRAGCACIIGTLQELAKDQELPVDVVGAFASQEEVGMRGAEATTHTVKPDLCILFEGSPSDDGIFAEGVMQGQLKHGVQIRRRDLSYISNDQFIDLAHQIGDEYRIPYQDAVRRGGSTNAGKISLVEGVVPVLVLGVPSRYVHTPFNYCSMRDVDAAVQMAVEVIRHLTEEKRDQILRKDAFRFPANTDCRLEKCQNKGK
ncbi:MAG: M20/M25/M40 family metallo-hydrolase [Lachnospiraceae bacterium]|nr:M20/M25/M40 family metallo-hydrolase [Lachnospiraceae bacterium]